MPALLSQEIGPIGYGLMGLTWRPSPCSEEQAFAAMRQSLTSGCNFWNAGEFYGTPSYNSLHLLNRYFTKYPSDASKVILSIKGGLNNTKPDGSPENIQRSVENTLAILDGKKKIDIFECARVDPETPLEVTLGELDKYVRAGKIGGIAMSEVGAESLRKAVSITKIVAVEVEVSLWALDPLSNGVGEICAKEGIPIVAYSPIGRGMLTGQIKSIDDLPKDDMRRHLPRFQPGNFETNIELVQELDKIAKRKDCTPAQLAISWVSAQSNKGGNPVIIPIPGATTAERVEENSKVIKFEEDELKEISSILDRCQVVGGRYAADHAKYLEG